MAGNQNGVWTNMIAWAVGGCVLVGIAAFFAYRRFGGVKVKRGHPRNVVVLRQFPRGHYAPSMSPFPVKLETYLRMAKVPYVNEFQRVRSPKGKIPWISYNDEDVSDSQFCVEYLNKKLDVDLNRHLTDSERAVARAFRVMTEEHLYWSLAMFRYVYSGKEGFEIMQKYHNMSSHTMTIMFGRIRKAAQAQGIGRHSEEEVRHLVTGDFAAISSQIGEKPFLMGSEPCEEDCTIFGFLAQCLVHSPGTSFRKLLTETYPNLAAYCDRMKERFWPDWDDCITHGGTKEATK